MELHRDARTQIKYMFRRRGKWLDMVKDFRFYKRVMDHEDGKLDHGDEAFRPVFKDEPLLHLAELSVSLLLLWFRSSDCTETSCHCASNFCRSVHDSFSVVISAGLQSLRTDSRVCSDMLSERILITSLNFLS